ncbi:unnamed protein product [Choristocarpus tenellus]
MSSPGSALTLETTGRFSVFCPAGASVIGCEATKKPDKVPIGEKKKEPKKSAKKASSTTRGLPSEGVEESKSSPLPPKATPPAAAATSGVPAPAEAMDLDRLAASVTKQGGVVRQMKKDGADGEAIKAEVARLVALKAELATAQAAVASTDTFDRKSEWWRI